LAGFLAPQLNEIGSSASGVGAPTDTTVGDALSGIGGLIDLLGGGTGGGTVTVTQKDRDNATLQPFGAEINRLQQLRDKIGPARFGTMLNSKFKEFAVTNGTLVSEAREIILGITGQDIGGEEFSIVNEVEEGVTKFLGTSRGQAVLPAVISAATDENGELDNDVAFNLLLEQSSLHAAEQAKLDALKLQADAETARGQINEARLAQVIDSQSLFYGDLALRDVVAFSALAVQNETKVSDSPAILAALRQRENLHRNEVMDAARRGGYANHPDFNVEDSLQPYTSTIKMIEDAGDDAVRAFEVLKAQDGATTLRVLNGLIGFGGGNQELQRFAFGALLDKESANLEDMIRSMNPTRLREFTLDLPLFTGVSTPVTEDNPPAPVSVISGDVLTAARGMNDFERKEEITVGVATFGSYVPSHSTEVGTRATAVDGFATTAAAVNSSDQDLAEATFDKIYDRKFFSTYEAITRFGDTVAANLQNIVAENLSVVFNQRKDLAETRIRNGFAETFPSINLQFNGNEVFVDLGEPKTTNERFLRDTLKRRGLPNTFEGAKQLAILEPNNPIFLPFSEARGINDIRSDVAYVNKIIGTVNRLPDLSTHIKPKIERSFGFENGQQSEVEVPNVIRVTRPEDVEKLSKGDTWEFIDADGDVHRGVL